MQGRMVWHGELGWMSVSQIKKLIDSQGGMEVLGNPSYLVLRPLLEVIRTGDDDLVMDALIRFGRGFVVVEEQLVEVRMGGGNGG